ncbi:YqjF family protein [Natrononativus amylolyticus]|uniref:YqjF family protein n=1 Tax=Natrononativus amylolyticus TaxID=2963434 RepID=UPI0020CBCC73|nr:DUF2071 domain-containing protein [Natrononativus amylolyticus]
MSGTLECRVGDALSGLPHPLSMTWLDGAFLHWPFEPDAVRRLVPDEFDVQTRDGSAWVSLVPFVLARAGLRGSPRAARWTGPELNVRTYVSADGISGLYFLRIDVASPWVAALGRGVAGVDCRHAHQHVEAAGDRVRFSSAGADGTGRFVATYEPAGPAARADPGSLEHWLVERRQFLSRRGARVLAGEIAHEPWPLRPATVEIEENDVFEAVGLPEPTAGPRAQFCGRLELTGSLVRPLCLEREGYSRPRRSKGEPLS